MTEYKNAFDTWLDTLIEEKGIDTESIEFEIEGESGLNIIPLGVVIEHIKITTKEEQKKIKDILVMIDFKNGDICHFFKHLAQAIAI
jgi:hypothetical protein